MAPHRLWLRGILLGAAVCAGFLHAQALLAQELDKQAESLKFVPANVFSYSAMLRNAEQFDAVAKSKAWAKLNELPLAKMGWQHLSQQLTGPLAPVKQWYSQPENKKLVDLLKDMVSDEIFCITGKNTSILLSLAAGVGSDLQLAPYQALLQGRNPNDAQAPQQYLKFALRSLAERADSIVAPELLMGFRLRDKEAGRAQLQRLEALGQLTAANAPLLKGRFQKTQINGGDFLTLRLDGQMIPWDQVPLADLEENPGEYDKLVKRLKNLKLTISLGIRDNFLLLAIAESTGIVEKLGQGKLLAARPEFQRLAKFADRKVTDIGYSSKALQALHSGGYDMEEMARKFLDVLKKTGKLQPEQEAKLRNDFKKFQRDVKGSLAKPGSAASVGFLTERGAESYSFDWSQHPDLDGTKPLTLLEHVGKAPLLFSISRSKYAPENYARVVKWIKVAHGYFEEFFLPTLDDTARDLYKQAMTQFQPLFSRLDKATGEMILPALADGQSAIVLDAKLKSKQWHTMLPQTEKALPILEPALVFGVKDAALLRKGLEEYRQTANKAIEAIGQILPIGAFIDQIKIQEPERTKVKEGALYSYSIPGILGLDSQLKPTGGLSAHVATLALSHEHALRILKKSTLKVDSPLLADPRKPLTGAVHFDWQGVVHAATPWLEVVVGNAGGGEGPNWMEHMKVLAQIATVVRSFTSVSYFEDGTLVTRAETVIRDLP